MLQLARSSYLCIAACAALLSGRAVAETASGELRHVASPDWRDQIVYFVMIDRFDDGDPSNNDQGAGEYDPADGARYSGGDLAGLVRRLDYIRDLGATALWITPPVRHQWWDGSIEYGGYHGYWGEHFAEVDPHFGTLADYQRLAHELHARDMFLIQDVVVNHTGNYFSYPDAYAPRDATRGYTRNRDSRPSAAPTQFPFSLNDARDPTQRAADIYHWTPDIADFGDLRQEQTYQLASLDDLNTENPTVRRALRASYGHWIREVGVDALRIDTAFYVPPDYFDDFLRADDAAAPGVLRVAAATGRRNFHVFGEGFGVDKPFADAKARKIETYVRDDAGRELLPAMLNFPLYGSLLDVFGRGHPSAVLAHRIESMMRLHARPHAMPSFVDNHDVDRFLAGGSEAGLRLALLAIHTLPGIPVVYYGTEQGFTAQRGAMFARGFESGGRDRFDPDAALYRTLRRLADLRRAHPTLRRGTPTVLGANPAAPGALVYAMRGDDGGTLLVALNSAPHPVLVANVDTRLAPGTQLAPRFALDDQAPALRVDAHGRLTATLPAHSGYVWQTREGKSRPDSMASAPELNSLPVAPQGDALELSGRAEPDDTLQLVIDGNLSRTVEARADAMGRWSARLGTEDFVDPAVEHRVVVWSPRHALASAAQTFRVERAWHTVLDLDDPAGDDHGPDGRYDYPTDPLWRTHRPADLRHLRVATSGSALRLQIRLNDVISTWSSPHDFDHVALTLFLELPGRGDGARVMPGQNAELPNDMRWHYRLRLGGWSQALFAHAGADARQEGSPVAAPLALAVDRDTDTLTITLPAAALGHPTTLEGARLYLSTWDYDGGFRALAPQAAAFAFGGGAADSAKIMDALGPVRLPAAPR